MLKKIVFLSTLCFCAQAMDSKVVVEPEQEDSTKKTDSSSLEAQIKQLEEKKNRIQCETAFLTGFPSNPPKDIVESLIVLRMIQARQTSLK